MLITRNSHSSNHWVSDLFFLAISLGLFYALWIGSYALFTPDEGRYSEVAREMIATQDYITPRINGVPFLDKPVLYYWLQVSAIKLFGLKEWALRFWPAALGILGLLVTYSSGRLLFNRRTGILGTIILATCPLYYGAAHYANLDLEVAVFVSCSLLFFIVAIQRLSPKERDTFLITSYFFAGLAALTKGLIGIAFPMMIVGAWVVLLNRWYVIKQMRLISGLILFGIITIPWYVLVQKANPEFFEFFFIKQQVSRFLTTDHFNNRTVPWFYIPIVLAGIIPWTFFIFQSLFQSIKNVYQDRQKNAVQLYLLIWLVLIFVFFSIPKSKTIGYILPVLPPVALLLAHYLNESWEKKPSRGIFAGIILYIGACITIAASYFILINHSLVESNLLVIPYLKTIALLFLGSGLLTLFLLKKMKTSHFFWLLTLTSSIFLLTVISSGKVINQTTVKPLASQLKPHLQPNDEIVAFFKYYQDLPLYLERRVTIVADWKAKDISQKDNWLRELWYGMSFLDTSEWLINEDTFWYRWFFNENKRLFIFTNSKTIDDFKVKAKLFHRKIYKISEANGITLISNVQLSPENPELS